MDTEYSCTSIKCLENRLILCALYFYVKWVGILIVGKFGKTFGAA